jgi:hypothetical protein
MTDAAARTGDFKYDVALSFAGEQREFVGATAAKLRELGVRVFYDDYEKVELWGKDLYEHLDYVYQRAARYAVVFVSADYAAKVWTNHERKSAQARAIQESGEYVLPFRFDDTELPGLRRTVGYLSASEINAAELADLINKKLGPRVRHSYFPPDPSLLFDFLNAEGDEEKEAIRRIALGFMRSLGRMTEEERVVLATVFTSGCPTEMPENMHIELDLLRRDLGMPITEIETLLSGMSSLGVHATVREHSETHSESTIAVTWNDHAIYPDDSLAEEYSYTRATEIADAMLRVGLDHYCAECTRNRIVAMDFSDLAESVPD